MDQTLEKMTKNLILGPILAHMAQISVTKFFLQVLPNEPNLRK